LTDGVECRLPSLLRLTHEEGAEIEGLLVAVDRVPGQVLAHGGVELLQAGHVRGEKDEHVAVAPRTRPARLEELGRRRPRPALVAGLGAVRILRPEHDQADDVLVGHVGARRRRHVHGGELAALLALPANVFEELDMHIVFAVLRGPVFGELGDARLRV